MRRNTLSRCSSSVFFLASSMSDLSVRDQLYLHAGRCITAWNHVENETLQLLEYAFSRDGYSQVETSVGYWSVVSFEARRKWCDSVVSYRLKSPPYDDLRARWANLTGRLQKKARKRAEVAHGTVIGITEPQDRALSYYLVPFYHKRQNDFNMLPHAEYHENRFSDFVKHVSVEELKHREQSFTKLRHDMSDFREDWRSKDEETGFYAL